MPKRATASASQLKPDPKHHSILASKFVNCMMWQGKKSVAQRIFYDALGVLDKRVSEVTEIEVFTQAVENVKPMIEVRSKRFSRSRSLSRLGMPITVKSSYEIFGRGRGILYHIQYLEVIFTWWILLL